MRLYQDKAELDPSWLTFRSDLAKPKCPVCEGVGFTEAEAFMCLDDRPERCTTCGGTGRV